MADYLVGIAETVAVVESPSGVGMFGVTLGEDENTTDIYTIGRVRVVDLSESVTSVDVYTMQRNSPRNMVDNLIANDDVTISGRSGYTTIVEGVRVRG